MNSITRAIIGVLLVLTITFSAIIVCQKVAPSLKIDITDQNIFTLSDGTKNILGRLNQPIKVKLFYAETATLKASDQIKFFNNYYVFVKELLEEYQAESNGMIDLEIIDPRPFSDEEAQALRYGLQRFPITEEENFFFGLAIQTPFGVEKTIPFFSPDRQNFVEYDISYLIDTAITRQKQKVGVLSSLDVMGDDISGYMAQMMQMQGQTPKKSWAIISQLKQKYDVSEVPADSTEIKGIDILLIVHPKDLSEQTLFAIDQFVLSGGRTIVCVDPYCVSDKPTRQEMQMGTVPDSSSDLNILLRQWGLEVPENTFAGDRALALKAAMMQGQRVQTIIGFLGLTGEKECFDRESVVTANLNYVRVLFAGAINETELPEESGITRRPIMTTTNRGNTWTISSAYELMIPDATALLNKFTAGDEPVAIGCQVTGKFKSAFPDGIEVESEGDEENSVSKTEKITGLTEAAEDCVIMVFSDVDFISDMIAYQDSFFGMKAVVGDNAALLSNSIDDMAGSSDLISIRSRGNFSRPFIVVDEIEARAEKETEKKIADINAEIAKFQQDLNDIASKARQGDQELLGSSIQEKKRQLMLDIRLKEKEQRDVKMSERQDIEKLGRKLRNICMLLTPAIILLIAIGLAIFRNARKRHYISHASDS